MVLAHPGWADRDRAWVYAVAAHPGSARPHPGGVSGPAVVAGQRCLPGRAGVVAVRAPYPRRDRRARCGACPRRGGVLARGARQRLWRGVLGIRSRTHPQAAGPHGRDHDRPRVAPWTARPARFPATSGSGHPSPPVPRSSPGRCGRTPRTSAPSMPLPATAPNPPPTRSPGGPTSSVRGCGAGSAGAACAESSAHRRGTTPANPTSRTSITSARTTPATSATSPPPPTTPRPSPSGLSVLEPHPIRLEPTMIMEDPVRGRHRCDRVRRGAADSAVPVRRGCRPGGSPRRGAGRRRRPG